MASLFTAQQHLFRLYVAAATGLCVLGLGQRGAFDSVPVFAQSPQSRQLGGSVNVGPSYVQLEFRAYIVVQLVDFFLVEKFSAL